MPTGKLVPMTIKVERKTKAALRARARKRGTTPSKEARAALESSLAYSEVTMSNVGVVQRICKAVPLAKPPKPRARR